MVDTLLEAEPLQTLQPLQSVTSVEPEPAPFQAYEDEDDPFENDPYFDDDDDDDFEDEEDDDYLDDEDDEDEDDDLDFDDDED